MKASRSTWKELVCYARGFLKDREKARIEIAKAAIKACDAIKEKDKKNFNLKRFAEAVGLNYKTLHSWVHAYKNVMKKLPKGAKDSKALNRAARSLPSSAGQCEVQDAYYAELNKSNETIGIEHGLSRLKTLKKYICSKADLKDMDRLKLREIKKHCDAISRKLRKFL